MRRLASALVLAAALGCTLAVADDEVVPWDQAEQHVGQATVVEGRVMGAHCSPTSCLLAFDPTFNRFTAVVQAKSFSALPPNSLDAKYVGRKVRVHGTVQLLDRKPEIVVERPSDLEVVVTQEERAQQKADAQGEVLDRLDTIVDRLDQLTDRLESMQARLEQLALGLDQRADQLAALEAAAQQPPPEPPSGGPPPRPGYEKLRTIKRGMTPAEVSRLAGDPAAVESSGNGTTIWYYDYGRSITFDERGRATSLVGFPAP
jgi:hypothetical protein